jgi:hypothetical protein
MTSSASFTGLIGSNHVLKGCARYTFPYYIETVIPDKYMILYHLKLNKMFLKKFSLANQNTIRLIG